MNYDGKTYRNLEGQVAYLTEVAETLDNKITEVAANIPSKMIVEELPEEGDPNITYYVGPKGTEPNLYYEVWVWVQEVEDGPFVWRELEDTDQVDLSGYLPKVETATTEKQVYTKNADGTQTMTDVAQSVVAGAIPLRGSSGQILVPTGTPTSDSAATSKGYVVGNFVAKQTGATTMYQVYGKATDGTQGMLDVTTENHGATLMFRDANGRTRVAAPSGDNDATNKKYCDDTFVPKVSTVTTFRQAYSKNPDGTQYMQVINGKDMDAGVDRIACFGTDGRLRVGEPVNAKDAATKGYVDSVIGQLIYKHQVTLGFTISSKSFTLTLVVLNGTSTAYTSTDGRQLLTAIKSSAYSIITDSWVDSKFWTVAVTASDKYIHDDTGIGFLLTAPVDGTTIYVDGIDPNYNANITGVTITDTVTTW